jgi:cytochrome c oxidase subunit 2
MLKLITYLNGKMVADVAEDWQIGFQDPATPIMQGIIDLHHDLFFFLVIVCVFVFWILSRTIYLFLESIPEVSEENSKRAETLSGEFFYRLPSRMTHHTNLEIIWTVIPSIILLLVAIPSFSLLYAMDEIVNPSLTVKIIGRQWYWSYEHGDASFRDYEQFQYDSYMILSEDLENNQYRLLETDNSLVLPTKINVRLLVTSSDVLHSWAVPSLGVKMDACPGRLNQLSLYIKREGTFYGQCSEICGVNHGFMPIQVVALELPEYYKWYDTILNLYTNNE